jgi:hypothetical protein
MHSALAAAALHLRSQTPCLCGCAASHHAWEQLAVALQVVLLVAVLVALVVCRRCRWLQMRRWAAAGLLPCGAVVAGLGQMAEFY